MDSDTSVPWSGALRMLAVPPWRAIRARTDSARPLRSAGTAAGSNPLPRSLTNTDTSAGSTSANSETTGAPDHFTALTVASRAAASKAARSSSRAQSPTVTASTATPCWASTSCWICRIPPASVVALSMDPGGLPSNSHERSSRSCARASDDLLRLVRSSLDQRQGLQHRVVHPRGDVGPFFGPDPGLALYDQVPRDAQPP